MRLWQKVFLVTLVTVILGINAVSYVLITKGFEIAFQSTKEGVVLYTANVITRIDSAYQKRMKAEALALPEEEVLKIVNEYCKKFTNNEFIVDFSNDGVVYNGVDEENKNVIRMYEESNGNRYIKSSDVIYLDGEVYRIAVKKNVTEVFTRFYDNINYVQRASTIIGLAIAFSLLFIIKLILRPLQQINDATKEISAGNYDRRINVTGGGEINELSENMNIMATEIEKNLKHIEELAENRRVFIANMTHELKTPLTSILGFANIMKIKDNITASERRKYASIIENEAKRLKELSSKLMELILIDNTTLETKPLDFYEVLYTVAESMNITLKAKELSLVFSAQSVIMEMDEELMKSLVYNVLDNAIKASPPNSTIRLCEVCEGGYVTITISDEGMGIPKDKLLRVSEPFYMADKARSRKAGGAGIGLALCKAVCEAHDGTMTIESKENIGTCVTLRFPLEKGENGQ
ncbi:MAG: HAMP domain-containing histidine kinase [Clostridiales bacterium]|nr:HAMP domain-containing histidine kinase [Clostridiales bacterium]